jgi:hypothetical protein
MLKQTEDNFKDATADDISDFLISRLIVQIMNIQVVGIY